MNPLFQEALASIFRWALAIGAGVLVSRGIWTEEAAATYVAAAALGLVALAWSLWQKYAARTKLVTALSMPPTTERYVEDAIARGRSAAPRTPKTEQPTQH